MHVLSEWTRDNEKLGRFETGEPNLDWEMGAVHGALNAECLDATSTSTTAVGLPEHSFTELSGFPGTGKTAIYLSLALEALMRGRKVLHISCNYSKFPFERARKYAEWKRERFEKRIHAVFLDSLDELVLLDLDWSEYAVIIFEQIDGLVKKFWSGAEQQRAYQVIFDKIVPLREFSCVLATGGCERHRNLDDTVIAAPKSVLIPKSIDKAARLMIYKKENGDSVLSTGLAFKATLTGLTSLPPEQNDYEVPLNFLSTKKRGTPSRQQTSMMMTPHSKSVSIINHTINHGTSSDDGGGNVPARLKRRNSFTTPVRVSSSLRTDDADVSREYLTSKRIRTMTPTSSRAAASIETPTSIEAPVSIEASVSSECQLNESQLSSQRGLHLQNESTDPTNNLLHDLPASSPPPEREDSPPLPESFIPSSPDKLVAEGTDFQHTSTSHPSDNLTLLPKADALPSLARPMMPAIRSRSMQILEEEAVSFVPNSQNDAETL